MLPQKAIVKEDVFSHIKPKQQYAKKDEVVTIVDLREHVAIVVKEDTSWFSVNIDKLIIQH